MTFYTWDGSAVTPEEMWNRFIEYYAKKHGYVDKDGKPVIQCFIGGIEGFRKAFIEAQEE